MEEARRWMRFFFYFTLLFALIIYGCYRGALYQEEQIIQKISGFTDENDWKVRVLQVVTTHSAVAEGSVSKKRCVVYFDENTLPLPGEVWPIQARICVNRNTADFWLTKKQGD